MSKDIVMTIALALVSIASVCITRYLIPWIRANMSAKDLEINISKVVNSFSSLKATLYGIIIEVYKFNITINKSHIVL